MAKRYPELERALQHTMAWLDSLATRPIPARASIDDLAKAFGTELPEGPTDPVEVIELMATAGEAGLVAIPSGRFYGFVMGGTHPAALAADWLVSAWDQNSGLRQLTPTSSVLEEIAAAWLIDLLGLPAGSAVGFVTGGTMANFTCLAAARGAVLRGTGWDEAREGLQGGPRIRVLVGAERHHTIDLTLRYLGLGTPEIIAADAQGRIDATALDAALANAPRMGTVNGPTIVCLQAGNVHSGAFDDFNAAIQIAHRHGAWVHVDGAFGLWAQASPRVRHLVAGIEAADSWSTDAHKTLSVPFDCGVAIVRDPAALRAAMGMHGDYLIMDDERRDQYERVPELSRRARGIPVWAVLRGLGSSGVCDLVERLCGHARAFAAGVEEIEGAQVLNDVVYTQVCVSFGDDARTQAVVQHVLEDGSAWMSGSRWRGCAVLRISVSNWSTTDDDVARSLHALRRAVAATS